MADLVPLDKPPAVLADRALQILVDFGYTDAPADTAQNFIIPPDFRPGWSRRMRRWTAGIPLDIR